MKLNRRNKNIFNSACTHMMKEITQIKGKACQGGFEGVAVWKYPTVLFSYSIHFPCLFNLKEFNYVLKTYQSLDSFLQLQ